MHKKMVPFVNGLKQRYLNLNIDKKITLCFFVLLFFSLLTSAFIDQTLYNDMNSKKQFRFLKGHWIL